MKIIDIFHTIIKGFDNIIDFLAANREIIWLCLQLLSPFILFIVILFIACLLFEVVIFTNNFYKKHLKSKLNKFDIKKLHIFKISKKTMKIIKRISYITDMALNNVSLSVFIIPFILYISGTEKTKFLSILPDTFVIFGISQIITLPYTVYKIKNKQENKNIGS